MSSIQFRSRIKPAINYAPKLNSFGGCCDADGNKTIKSFIECFAEGGQFVVIPRENITPENTEVLDLFDCPQIDTRKGCCCACSYVTPGELSQIPNYPLGSGVNPYLSSGVRSNVTKCECESRGGKWTEGECPELSTSNWISYCVAQNEEDVRTPSSCCHMGYDTETGWPTEITCTEVCSKLDCAAYSTETNLSEFREGFRCSQTNCASSGFKSIAATNSILYDGFEIGSCYTLEEVNGELQYNCSLSPESLCAGYWVEEQDENNPYCTSSYQPSNPVKLNGVYDVQRMTTSDFNSIGLEIGDKFQGGIYIGIFEPSPLNGRSSEVYSNITFGNPDLKRFVADSVGGTDKKWAIIVNETRYSVPFLLTTEQERYYSTSLWDGYYNTYGNNSTFTGIQTALTTELRYKDRGGFIDYYLPSIYELGFYAAYLKNKSISQRGNLISSSFFNTKYLNSGTNKSTIGNNTFIYGQSILTENSTNYKNILIAKKNIETALFFRRIVLT